MTRHEIPGDGGWPVGDPALAMALLSGGDERLAIDPHSGRNRYGIPARRVPGEVFFASSTASPVSRRGHAAAASAFARLLAGTDPAAWCETLRERLQSHLGIAGCAVVLAGSGTEAELVLLALASHRLGGPLTSIVVAPTETGSGVMLAAGGRHFLESASCARTVAKGTIIEGFDGRDLVSEGVPIRDQAGQPLAAEAVDAAVTERALRALRAGRRVVLRCVDTSKTGLSGFRRQTAAALAAAFPDRVLVVVDACQLRCSPDEIRTDLAAGFFVLVTGSKFIGGPAFAGAVLVPPAAVDRLRSVALPRGLGAYSAVHDWPARLRPHGTRPQLSTSINTGLGLRWEAALAEMDALAAVTPGVRAALTETLGTAIRDAVSARPGLHGLASGSADARLPTIFPVLTEAPDGTPACAKALHRALMEAGASRRDLETRAFHVGQPVAVGQREALRICIGAGHLIDAAAHLTEGATMAEAVRPFTSDLDALLARWDRLRMRAVPLRRHA